MNINKHTAVFVIIVITGIFVSFTLYHFQEGNKALRKTSGEIRRIISITPSLTECLYALGCGGRIVGVGDFCTYPEDAKSIPRVGGYINPNLEVILSLKPDLIVIQGKHEKVAGFCSVNGILFERFEIDSLNDVFGTLSKLGLLLEKKSTADSLCKVLKEGLDDVASRVSGLPRRTVFYSLGHTPGNINTLFTAGKPSFISELLTIAGGKNIFEYNNMLYPEISKETLVKRAPDIILESVINKSSSRDYIEKLYHDWEKFTTLPAVQNKRIYMINEEFLEIPGPRIVMAARLFGRIIHPEAFDGE